jgi:hypothetical protein
MLLETALLMASVAIQPAEVEVHCQFSGTLPNERISTLIVATPIDQTETQADPIVKPFDVPGRTHLRLPQKTDWSIAANAEGYWSTRMYHSSQSHTELDDPVELTLYRMGTLVGSLATRDGHALPEEISMFLTTVPSEDAASNEIPLEREEVRCPISNGAFRCQVPAGRFDFKVWVKGFAPEYFWSREVSVGSQTDWAELELETGASVVGWVEAVDASLLPESCVVELGPWTQPNQPNSESTGLSEVEVLSTTINNRGFFRFNRVQRGLYTVSAKQPGLAPGESNLRVLENVESELTEPLKMRPFVTAEFTLSPPFNPYGARWIIRLTHKKNQRLRYEHVVPDEGFTAIKNVVPGRYLVSVLGEDEDSTRWLREEIELDQATFSHALEIPTVLLTGELYLGDDPVQAGIWFGGARNARRVFFESNSLGEFEGYLPDTGRWPVEVDYKGNRILLHAVEIELDAGSSSVHVKLNLPETRLAGEVVDDRGHPISDAMVVVRHQRGELSKKNSYIRTDEEGRFESNGVETGHVILRAQTPEGESGWHHHEIKEGDDESWIKLVLEERSEISGVVLSSAGPVPGARIFDMTISTDQTGPKTIKPTMTSVDGSFSVEVPSSAISTSLLVVPPAFAVSLFSTPLPSTAPIMVQLERNGANIKVTGDLAKRGSVLVHKQAVFPITALRQFVSAVKPDGMDGYVLPRMESGEYTICSGYKLLRSGKVNSESTASSLGCVSGFLAPGGELELSLD